MPDITISKALNRAYRQQPVSKADFDKFTHYLKFFFEQIETVDTEEKVKGDLMDFLKLAFYGQEYKVSPNGSIDCAIHLGCNIKDPVGVIIEVKMPSNTSEMVQRGILNRKALQELLLYWLRERVSQKNISLKKLIVTNIYEYFIFDAQEFERVFYSNKKLIKLYEEFSSGVLASAKTDFFYRDIAAPLIEEVADTLNYTWFDIREYRKYLERGNERKLIELYKVFSPENLLKIQFQTDSNKLNVKFYSELLHIIGLEEIEDKEGSRRIISRKKPLERNQASLLESTITILDSEDWIDRVDRKSRFGNTREEQLFNVAMSLCINWINRILFMKLLEAQMVRYHKGDNKWSFMNPKTISDYDELNKLFFQVLAKRPKDRLADVNTKYGRIPYLNSSLFEMSDLEAKTIRISNLNNSADMQLFSGTVLRDGGKPRYKALPTLRYLLEFLDAYDFSSEGSEDINENSKTLINASVLGLIFEKINGHKDGSVFTPGAITMWMSGETIRRAVIRKFNDAFGWNCQDYESLKNKDFDDIRIANEIVDSLRICDPAVGSGHFLVSVLNEIIWIKYDLGILTDGRGSRLKKQDYELTIENDELIVSDSDGCPFSYIPGNAESQRVQETLFREKRKIIENCLFGVDLNRNAVDICRLRLWIELLKNAYYTKESNYEELETLPNIDINIKTGNSLLHKFGIEQDISQIVKDGGFSVADYKRAVANYKNAHNKEEKHELESLILSLKNGIKKEIGLNDPLVKREISLRKELSNLEEPVMFEENRKVSIQIEKKKKALNEKLVKVQAEIDEIRNNRIYVEAFEWRIEFPEVLDDDGRFIGFDCIIGNPPYIQLQKMGESADALARMGYATYERTGDIYCLFYELGQSLLRDGGLLCYITSNKWMRAGYGEKTREFFSSKTNPLLLVDFSGVRVFENATVDTNVLMFAKETNVENTFCAVAKGKGRDILNNMSDFMQQNGTVCGFSGGNAWVILSTIEQSIKSKIEAVGTPLKDWDIQINYGIKTGYNEAFIITTDKREEILRACLTEDERTRTAELIRPILRGRDIKRYGYDWADLWLIATFPSRHYDIDDYPSVKDYLLSFGIERLEQTGETHIINGEKVKARKKTNNKWFETQDSINYWEDFDKPKIIWGNLSLSANYSMADQSLYINAPANILVPGNEYVLAVLNSKVADYYIRMLGVTRNGGYFEYKPMFVQQMPIPKFKEDDAFLQHINSLIAEHRYDEVDGLIFRLYGLNDEESNYILAL